VLGKDWRRAGRCLTRYFAVLVEGRVVGEMAIFANHHKQDGRYSPPLPLIRFQTSPTYRLSDPSRLQRAAPSVPLNGQSHPNPLSLSTPDQSCKPTPADNAQPFRPPHHLATLFLLSLLDLPDPIGSMTTSYHIMDTYQLFPTQRKKKMFFLLATGDDLLSLQADYSTQSSLLLNSTTTLALAALLIKPPSVPKAKTKNVRFLPKGDNGTGPCPFPIPALYKYWSQRARYSLNAAFKITPLTFTIISSHNSPPKPLSFPATDDTILSSWYSITPEAVSHLNAALLLTEPAPLLTEPAPVLTEPVPVLAESTSAPESSPAPPPAPLVVLDPFCGVGRDTISLSLHAIPTYTIAADLSLPAVLTTSKNLKLYNVPPDSVLLVVGDCVSLMRSMAGGGSTVASSATLREALATSSKTAEGYHVVTCHPEQYDYLTPVLPLLDLPLSDGDGRTLRDVTRVFLSPPWNNTDYYDYAGKQQQGGSKQVRKKS